MGKKRVKKCVENRMSPEEGGEAKLLLESTAPMAMMGSGPESRRYQASTGSYLACSRVKIQGPSSQAQVKIPFVSQLERAGGRRPPTSADSVLRGSA